MAEEKTSIAPDEKAAEIAKGEAYNLAQALKDELVKWLAAHPQPDEHFVTYGALGILNHHFFHTLKQDDRTKHALIDSMADLQHRYLHEPSSPAGPLN